jgi:D-3-phosphoglycerate dehydrogenase
MSDRIAVAADMIHRNEFMRRAVLQAYPDAKLHEGPRMNEEQLISFLHGHAAAIVGFEPITERVLSALPEIKVLSKFGAGCETIDFHALKRHGVRFGYEWGVNKLAVAELAVCFMIAGLRWLMPLNLSMRAGDRPGIRNGRLLTGRIVGIHGCGNIGKEVVRLLQPFGCKIVACDINDFPGFYRDYDVTPVSFDRLLEQAEVLTLHLPKTKDTLGLYTRAVLEKLRPDCLLINTCRGGIVDEEALADRLEAGQIKAACFDVFAVEPASNDRLIRNPNMLATPHIGASAEEIRVKMIEAAISGLTHNALVEPAQFYA